MVFLRIRGGLMVHSLDSGLGGLGSSPCREHCAVPLSTQVYN